MPVTIAPAVAGDVMVLFALRRSIADDQTRRHGRGRWSAFGTERGIERGIEESRVIVARAGGEIVGSLRLDTRKPWAIDVSMLTPVARAMYVHDVMVRPDRQRQGVGRALILAATKIAASSGAGALRLSAYDAEAGAGGFYLRCGFAEAGRAIYRSVPLVYYELVL